MIKIYGLKNCDTCRKVVKWLESKGATYEFSDFRKDGLDAAKLDGWLKSVGWEVLLNKRGTTWRGLDSAIKDSTDESNVAKLMLDHPALIKRPVIEVRDQILVGFKQAEENELASYLAERQDLDK